MRWSAWWLINRRFVHSFFHMKILVQVNVGRRNAMRCEKEKKESIEYFKNASDSFSRKWGSRHDLLFLPLKIESFSVEIIRTPRLLEFTLVLVLDVHVRVPIRINNTNRFCDCAANPSWISFLWLVWSDMCHLQSMTSTRKEQKSYSFRTRSTKAKERRSSKTVAKTCFSNRSSTPANCGSYGMNIVCQFSSLEILRLLSISSLTFHFFTTWKTNSWSTKMVKNSS